MQAESWWADPKEDNGTDLAVVTIPEDVSEGRECELAPFGRISDCAAVLTVEAFGFPLSKLRASPGDVYQSEVFRDFEQATGHPSRDRGAAPDRLKAGPAAGRYAQP